MSVKKAEADGGSFDASFDFDSRALSIQGNAKSKKSRNYALLAIGVISVAIGIIGILAHQGVLGKKVLDSLKKIPNSIGGKDLVLGISIVLVSLPPIVLLICIAKSKRDVQVTSKNIKNIFIIKKEVVSKPTEFVNDSYNAEICGTDNDNQYILSIHYKNKNDQSCIHNTPFMIDSGRVIVRDKNIFGGNNKSTYRSFKNFIIDITREIKDAKEPLESLIFQGPNGLVKQSCSIFDFD